MTRIKYYFDNADALINELKNFIESSNCEDDIKNKILRISDNLYHNNLNFYGDCDEITKKIAALHRKFDLNIED